MKSLWRSLLFLVVLLMAGALLSISVGSASGCDMDKSRTRTVQCNCTNDFTVCICKGMRYKLDQPAERNPEG